MGDLADAHQDLSLVVFLPVTEGQLLPENAADGALRRLREQAIVATDICFVISDPTQPDNPLVWVNPAFTRVTGYSLRESVGRNCRFLQGPQTDPAAVARIREAIEEQQPVQVTLLNYRADGSAFWNQLSLTPVFDGRGVLVSFVGVQTDVTARVSMERERQAAFAAERRAREIAQSAEQRLGLMAAASTRLTGTLDVDALLGRLTELCVPELANCAFAGRLNDEHVLTSASLRHTAGHNQVLDELVERVLGRHLTPRSPAADAVARTTGVYLPDVTAASALTTYPDTQVHHFADQLDVTSLIALPLMGSDATLGVLVLTSAQPDAFPPARRDLLTDLAARAGLALDNARLYQTQRSVAETLQRVMLAQLPSIAGLQVAAHYESASSATAVGGDFYDLLPLPDGSIGISIGDVSGHDIDAAATMGQLRTLLRTTAHDRTRTDPADVLARVDEQMTALGISGLATLAHAHAHPPDAASPHGSGHWRLDVASAGHPPLLLRAPTGEVRLLTEAHGRLLGVGEPVTRTTTTVTVPRGTILVAYTDGLIERSGHDLDEGLDRLSAAVAAQPRNATPEGICRALLPLATGQPDDVALMVIGLT